MRVLYRDYANDLATGEFDWFTVVRCRDGTFNVSARVPGALNPSNLVPLATFDKLSDAEYVIALVHNKILEGVNNMNFVAGEDAE